MTDQNTLNHRLILFIVLSILFHIFLGFFFYRVHRAGQASLPPETKQEVVWVNPQDVLTQPPVISAKNLPLADIAKPTAEKIPEKAHFASQYNSSVKEETVAPKLKKDATLQKQTADEGPKGKPSEAEPENFEKPVADKKPEKEVSLSDLSLKPTDFQDLISKEKTSEKPDKKLAAKSPPSEAIPYTPPVIGKPGSLESGSFVNDFFPNIKIGGKTYLNTAAFPDVQYFTQLKRIFRLRFNPISPLRRHFAGNRVVTGKVGVSMAVVVGRDGKLKELFVIKSSGIPGYDSEALRTVRESAPFSAPPVKVMDKDGALRMNWNFITYL
jgi:TonB family protein